jgi:hypothetical protein
MHAFSSLFLFFFMLPTSAFLSIGNFAIRNMSSYCRCTRCTLIIQAYLNISYLKYRIDLRRTGSDGKYESLHPISKNCESHIQKNRVKDFIRRDLSYISACQNAMRRNTNFVIQIH